MARKVIEECSTILLILVFGVISQLLEILITNIFSIINNVPGLCPQFLAKALKTIGTS